MQDIKNLDSTINFEDKSQVQPLAWDVVMYHNDYVQFEVTDSEIPAYSVDSEQMIFLDFTMAMDAFYIPGYPHTIYGSGEAICHYVCPRGEKPSLDNLEPFDSKHWDLWGFSIRPHVYTGKHGVDSKYKGIITRNGQEFEEVWANDLAYLAIKIQSKIYKLQEPMTPFNFTDKNYIEQIVGTKAEWKGRPCVITSYIERQNCVMLDIVAGPNEYDEGEPIKTHIFDENFDWYPDID